MNAGQMRHRVTLQRPAGVPDTLGELDATHVDVGTFWAKVEPLSGSEEFLAAQPQSGTTHKVTLRYSAAVAIADATYRFHFGKARRVVKQDDGTYREVDVDRYLAITNVRDENEGHEWLICRCIEGLREQ